MVEVSQERFEQLVSQGIDAIPERFARELENVAIVIEDLPDEHQIQKIRLRHGWMLFGLYEGIPRTRRGSNYTLVLPDKITIFKKPLEAVSVDENDLKERVKNTVWHEVAHYFGLGHKQIYDIERKNHEA